MTLPNLIKDPKLRKSFHTRSNTKTRSRSVKALRHLFETRYDSCKLIYTFYWSSKVDWNSSKILKILSYLFKTQWRSQGGGAARGLDLPFATLSNSVFPISAPPITPRPFWSRSASLNTRLATLLLRHPEIRPNILRLFTTCLRLTKTVAQNSFRLSLTLPNLDKTLQKHLKILAY